MNGAAPDIQLIRPFNEALEMTKQILFRPFDLKKWFIIGVGAWLTHLGGGGGLNFRTAGGSIDQRTESAWKDFGDIFEAIPWWIIVAGIAFLVVLFMALVIVFAWLRARGRFIFTDCVVRNRAAVAEPWREFKRLGNSFFLFSLLTGCGLMLVSAVMITPVIVLAIRGRTGDDYLGAPLLTALILAVVVIGTLGIAWAVITYFMAPIMYRRRCLATEGFRATISLIANYPGEITLYILFTIVIGIASIIVTCLATCLTCCVTALPYIGTVILLPLHVFFQSFLLLFLRQFGPEYDAWAGLPARPAGIAGLSETSGQGAGQPPPPAPHI